MPTYLVSQPTYMDESPDDYLFDTREECCKTWFSFESCTDSSAEIEPKFYPDWGRDVCGQKSNFEPWELDSFEVYDSLHECCKMKFSHNLGQCCSADGLGGCDIADGEGAIKYLPNWTYNKCDTKSVAKIQSYEEAYSSTTASSCCNEWFSWEKIECCKRSGGC